VLDVGNAELGGKILLVDPVEGAVKGSIAVGYHPNYGICSSASRLYVEDGPQSSGFLSIFDTQTGKLIRKTLLADRASYTVLPANTGVGCSGDGKWLFVQIMKTSSPGVDEHWLSVIDAVTGQAVSSTVPLPGCGIARFVPWPFGNWDVAAECSRANTMSFARLGPGGEVTEARDVPLTWGPRVANGNVVNDGQRITTSAITDPGRGVVVMLRAAGGIDQMNPATLSIQTVVADSWQQFLPQSAAAISPNLGLIYVGFAPYGQGAQGGGTINGISVVRAADMVQQATITTTLPFASLAVSSDGRSLYAVDTHAKAITVIDTGSMKETKRISGIGSKPALMIIQP